MDLVDSEASDRPRLFRDPARVAERRSLLGSPHVAPLTAYARALREQAYGEVPDFDPWDGGVNAQALFLLEKPGPRVARTGFVSRNNDDPTAENTFNFMKQAGIPREATCLWNVIPGWNGTIKVTGAELRRGVEALGGLAGMFPCLRVVVFVGRKAARALPLFNNRGLKIFASAHPSPQVFAGNRALWDDIPKVWARAAEHLDPPPSG